MHEDYSGLVPLDSVGGPRGGGGGRGGGRGGSFGGGRRPPFRRPPLPPQAYVQPYPYPVDPGYNAIDPITGEPYYDPSLDTMALAAPAATPFASGRSRQALGARAGLGISNLGAPSRGGYGRGGFRGGFGGSGTGYGSYGGAGYGGASSLLPLASSTSATSALAPALLRNQLLQQQALQQQAAQAALAQASLSPYRSLLSPALSVNPYSALGYGATTSPLMLMGLTEAQAGEVGSLPGMMSELDGYATYANPGFAQSPPRCWRMR